MDLKKIAQETLERYSARYISLGRHIRTLGWGSEEQQLYRFENTLIAIDLNKKSIVDVGCGFGDYADFLRKEKIRFASYTGWDMNPDFINEAKKGDDIHREFFQKDISDNTALSDFKERFDAAVMLGLLNFNLKSESVNYSFSENLVTNAFSLVKRVLIVDFLSSHRFEGYPKEDFVFYHEPSRMLEFALSLSSNVVLKHDYAPIPQKEFMLFIYK